MNDNDTKMDDYTTEILSDTEDDDQQRPKVSAYAASSSYVDVDESFDPFSANKSSIIAERESDYMKKGREARVLSPERVDPFASPSTSSGKGRGKSEGGGRSYVEVMKQHELDKEERRVQGEVDKKVMERDEELKSNPNRHVEDQEEATERAKAIVERRRQRDQEAASRPAKRRNRWDETPDEPAPSSSSKWEETPTSLSNTSFDATPLGNIGLETPVASSSSSQEVPATPSTQSRLDREMETRNRYMSDEELNTLFPSAGYTIVQVPETYVPIRTPARKAAGAPTPAAGDGFVMLDDVYTSGDSGELIPEIPGMTGSLQYFKPEDAKHFAKLLDTSTPEESMDLEELKERKVLRLLLKIKNGEPPARRSAMKQITERARDFGAACLFNQILPLLMSPTLEDQERHLLVKIIDRVLFKLDDLVRPFVHKILIVIEPLLIDEDYYARIEGREIISNLSKAAGLATMISTMRPDIDHVDEYVRNTTSRAFAVVASALGIPALLPFLKAVCKSKKSWQARHTGIKIVLQIAILMGPGVLPHLRHLVNAISAGLTDENHKVRQQAALAIAALAEACAPYGIESFEGSLKALWDGVRAHRGKGLAAFLKAIGFLVPLMDVEHAAYFTKGVMTTVKREFQSPDDEMKKIVLKVVKQCVGTEGVTAAYIKEEILSEFFKSFWVYTMAKDRRTSRQLIDTTLELAQKVGVSEIVGRIVNQLKDESEPFRKMVMECIDKVIASLGTADVDKRLEELLIDGILYSFQEQSVEDVVMLNGFGTVVSSLGVRLAPYLQQVASTVLWRLNNKSASVRQQAADLVVKVAPVVKVCGEEKMLGTLGMVLYEYLGEEYPDVLASIVGGLKAIVENMGMSSMNPPIKDLLPRLTPILKNRHEKVAENVVELIGIIGDRGAELVSAREWMRICFELLDMLKAHRKSIRRATIRTFGYIAKAIGPQDVLATLLNNLKVQERQNRVATTVAIAIVAETCSPFTVLPALMNEYRVPELNVQNGVLKSLSFLFEYIGEIGKDYIYAVTPLLEDALIDRDLVHRQTACTAVKHMSLGVVGLNCEDAIMHLFNYVWPNVFETSPQVINSVIETIDAIRVALGPATVLQYLLQGIFHPARRVREVYWKIYNNLYIGAQDSLVPFYPRVEDDQTNRYAIHELDLFL